MEIKANYFLIGLFTIAGLVGSLLFFIWLASFQVDRQFQNYDVFFNNVSGLGQAGDVRYNGLSVGQVLRLDIEADDPRIRVRIEVDADTPVRTDSVATLEQQGVTGVSYVSLTGGSADAPLLRESSGERIPVIRSQQSALQTLADRGPDIVTNLANLIAELQGFASDENKERVATILQNASDASGSLETVMSDFSSVAQTVGKFTDKIDPLAGSAQETLREFDETLATARTTLDQATETLAAASETLNSAKSAIDVVGGSLESKVPEILDSVAAAITSVETAVIAAADEAKTLLRRFETTADLADARLTDLGGTVQNVDAALQSAENAFNAVVESSNAVEELFEGTGAELVDDARETLKLVDQSLTVLNETLKTDWPVVVADIREATSGAATVMREVEGVVAGLPGQIDALSVDAQVMLETATGTLRRAEETLGKLDNTLASADGALSAAEEAFSEVSGIVKEEVRPTAADIRSAAAQAETTMAALTRDLPDIAADLRETAGRARHIAEVIEGAANSAAPAVRDFAEHGLPEFTQFAREAQSLLSVVERLIQRIERDPPRFFFGNARPEFRR